MEERIKEILIEIIKNPDIKMASLTKQLNLTRRQINYAISKYNEELSAISKQTISRNKLGDFFIPDHIIEEMTRKEIRHQGISSEAYKPAERIILILVYLLLNKDFISSDHLVDLLKISKDTFFSDIKEVSKKASLYHLSIKYSRQFGYEVEGKLHNKLQLISDSVRMWPVLRSQQVKDRLAISLKEEQAVHLVKLVETSLHVSYSDESIDYLLATIRYLYESYSNARKHAYTFDDFTEDICQYPEYVCLKKLIEKEKISLDQFHFNWLTLVFLSSNIYEQQLDSIFLPDDDLSRLIHEMVSKFEEKTLITIRDRERFVQRMMCHLRPACFRIKFHLILGIDAVENLIDKESHHILRMLMKELLEPIEHYLNEVFPSDEVELLCYYFGSQLNALDKSPVKTVRAAVVCTNGIIVSKLMLENLKEIFPEVNCLIAVSARNFYRYSEDYDIVFTNSPLESSIPQYLINPIMTDEEKILLRYRVIKELGLKQLDGKIDQLIHIIRKNAHITNDTKLRDEIASILIASNQEINMIDNNLPDLSSYMSEDMIQFTNKVMSWQEAITKACEPLLKKGIVNENYIMDCLNQASKEEYVSFLGTNMCIPHTSMPNTVMGEGISLLASKEAIEFPNGFKVHLILPLAFQDLTRHLKAMHQLVILSEKSNMVKTILNASNEKMVFDLITMLGR